MLLALAGLYVLRKAGPDPELTTPVLALQAVAAKPLFYTPYAQPFLVASRPDLIVPEDRDKESSRSRQFALAMQNPGLWRQLDHKEHFETLLLAGPNQFRPLIQHLLETKDFSLVYIDHTSLIFQRNAPRKWEPQDLERVREKFANRSNSAQAEFLAQAAGRLIWINETRLAKGYLDEALKKDRKNIAAWTQSAEYHLRLKQYDEGLSDADQALSLDETFLPAMVVRAQISL